MYDFVASCFFLSLILYLIGVMSPKTALFFLVGIEKTRKRASVIYGSLILTSLVGIFIFSPSGSDKSKESFDGNNLASESHPPQQPKNQKIDKAQIPSLLVEGRNAYDKKQYMQAFKIFLPLAESGNAEAQNRIGNMYLEGFGVEENYEQALKWCTKSAEQGYPNAWHNLGFMYSNGKGVAQSDIKAVEWYRKAADQGVAAAQVNLGIAYEDGLGVDRDYEQAAEWYRKAAEQNRATGLNNLGIMYLHGRGVRENHISAQTLFILASVIGSEEGEKNKRVLEPQLSFEELDEAKRLAKSWTVGTPLPTRTENIRYTDE
ncbi:MAG: tetratricopeptide repeat protein [Agitococcus sp.]|nr:tetratricopeptide repeat protein [Agitococcus sp.]